jgi:hypothetical protein
MHVEKKLREVRFFLDQMREQERRAFGDKERFDFYLSAFPNAARTVDNRLRYEQPAYRAWREAWNVAHSAQDKLIKFIHDDRDSEIHESASNRITQDKEIELGIGESYSDPSGVLTMFASPSPLLATNVAGTMPMPRYVYVFAETERPVTEVCAECLEFLTQMVDEFGADQEK